MDGMKDRVCEFRCNIDDMTAEEIAFAIERIMAAGAKDVTAEHVVMKKGRPGTVLTVMCADTEDDRRKMIEAVFRYTTTIGIREIISDRYILEREQSVIATPLGNIRRKTVRGYGVERHKFEYEDLARIARENSMSLDEVRHLAEKCAEEER